jgi:2,4-dienoyl-CoA reductase-like NADH-dependent reductase (Old Yellow Enzyme family)
MFMSSNFLPLEYENNIVRCKATRNIPEIEMVGFKLNPVEENVEFNTLYWVARELARNGLVDYIDATLDNNEWTQIHFKERINPAGPPGPLPDDYYTKAYQSFTSSEDLDISTYLNRIRARYRDILESRINRITRLASAEADSPTRVLQPQEISLYDKVRKIVSKWRKDMRGIGE